MEQRTLEQVLDKAIEREEEACTFYEDLAGRVEDVVSQDALHFMAREELKHKTILEQYKSGELGMEPLPLRMIVDARVVEALGVPDVAAPMHHKDIFLIAARREKASQEFYQRLAEEQLPGELQSLLLRFAEEEKRHKEKAEYLYCNAAFPQTDGG